ncbi:GIY-YIG nuclease family protein [Streptomyces echinatus]|uniref:Putative GIY-YIG superfamily endonuclease n=1 Tax=Streptomyces echinatus TaxID=67293 RepID=A0A7W9UV60_9ACTN|nr:GIY-YIG nuclease family protein [Streptomyces echinatus]MBB5932343.1 putative GIY-YIG superfamily endonuclease [Streptomyces echinatus]
MTRRPYKNMPDQGRTSLYRLLDAAGRLLYIGISCKPEKRYDSHRWHKPHAWRHDIASYTNEWFDTREEAEAAEITAIRSELPLYNRMHHPDCDDEPWSGYPKSAA